MVRIGCLEDLERSGLSKPSILKKLRIERFCDTEATQEIADAVLHAKKHRAISYEIPYFELDGTVAKFSRWKLIDVGEKEPIPLKYFQEEKTIPRLYMPPLVDWKKIAGDPTQRIIVTEGEKKAACATSLGLPTIGLGGVWNWKTKTWGHYDDIPDFKLFVWKGRTVEICFDGDMTTNENVLKAMRALTSALASKGAHVHIRYLPKTDGKSALDDFLVDRGVRAYEDLTLEEAPESGVLTKLNEEVAYVTKLNGFVSLADGLMFQNKEQLERRFGTVKIMGEKGQPLSAVNVWVTWPHRRTLDDVTYAPGRDRIVDGMFNTWRGWGAQAKRGDVSSILEVVRSVENSEWLLQWLAYPVQNPGAKLFTAVILWAIEQRTGKSLVGDVMRKIYGPENSSYITSHDLKKSRNDWLQSKQFVHGDEVMLGGEKSDLGALKSIITGDVVRVDIKYAPELTVPNKANLFLTSNQPDAIRLEKGDRRFFVGQLSTQRPNKFWSDMDKWSRNGGAAAFRWYLENQVDCESFDPTAPAPYTEEKQQMIYDGAGALSQWILDLINDPEEKMKGEAYKSFRIRCVFTAGEIMSLMPEEFIKQHRVHEGIVGRELYKAGAVRCDQRVVRTGDGTTKRLLAIRNLPEWRAKRSDVAAWIREYDKGRGTNKRIAELEKKDKVTDINTKRRK